MNPFEILGGVRTVQRSSDEAPRGFTRGDWKADREELGLSVSQMADMLGVSDRAVKRWERGMVSRDAMPHADAWSVMDNLMSLYRALADKLAEDAGQAAEDGVAVMLYYRNPADYAEDSDAPSAQVPFSVYNAAVRRARQDLESRGYEVELRLPVESDVEYVFSDDPAYDELEDRVADYVHGGSDWDY